MASTCRSRRASSRNRPSSVRTSLWGTRARVSVCILLTYNLCLEFTAQSTTQDLYSTSERPLDPYAVAQTQRANADLVQKSRNSNFTIASSVGRPAKFAGETSAGHAYTPKKLAMREVTDIGNPIQTMRVANFKFGNEKRTDYGTTTD